MNIILGTLIVLFGSKVQCSFYDRTSMYYVAGENLKLMADAPYIPKRLRSSHFEIEFNTNNMPYGKSCDQGSDVQCYVYYDGYVQVLRQKLNTNCQNVNLTSAIAGQMLSAKVNTRDLHVYGGNEQAQMQWPFEKLQFENFAYVSKQLNYNAALEPYWLTSAGLFIYVYPHVPLFISSGDGVLELMAKHENPYLKSGKNQLEFVVCQFDDPRTAHMYAVKNYLGTPTGLPDIRRVQQPIWSTWVRYKQNINQSLVLDYANQIRDNGYKGQIQIDDHWEDCYGNLQPDTSKFPDMRQLVKQLKNMGFRVAIWVHPFVNVECQPSHDIGIRNGYFVTDVNNETTTRWWNGETSYVDFENPAAAAWWKGRLRALQRATGVDGFKFDGGESSFAPAPARRPASDYPETILKAYVRTIADMGTNVHTRVARGTQQHPIFVTIMDRESEWSTDLGLQSMVMEVMHFNMIGYSYVVPDMIGGNSYRSHADEELFTRWIQANTFMVSMQFSLTPWDFGSRCARMAKKFVALHESYSEYIVNRMIKNAESGEPVNPPIWWIAPHDPVALECDSEFMLGDDILVAPVLKEYAVSRDIYLPEGTWVDGNDKERIIIGPIWLTNYSADLEVLPYFIKLRQEPVDEQTATAWNIPYAFFMFVSISVLVSLGLIAGKSITKTGSYLRLRKKLLTRYGSNNVSYSRL